MNLALLKKTHVPLLSLSLGGQGVWGLIITLLAFVDPGAVLTTRAALQNRRCRWLQDGLFTGNNQAAAALNRRAHSAERCRRNSDVVSL